MNLNGNKIDVMDSSAIIDTGSTYLYLNYLEYVKFEEQFK